MNTPDDLRYTENHEWVRDEGDGTATIGVTDFALGELGDVVFVELEPVGSELERDDVFGTVEAVKTVSDLYCPVSGTITAINDSLEDSPEQVNSDPYGEGWMVEVQPADGAAPQGLLDAAASGELVSD